MKHCTQMLFAVLCMFIVVNSTAQKASPAKPYLFKNFPAVINCTESQLAGLFTTVNDVETSLLLPGNLTLKGPVKWWAKTNTKLQTVSIKLTGFNNILFSVTRRYDINNNVLYSGHLFNTGYADGYELKRSSGNHYQLIKIETDKILETCNSIK